jgi:hypothetical protein
MIAGGHYQIQQSNHDLVKIEKFIQENITTMEQQVHSFSIFTQTKKGWNAYSPAAGPYSAAAVTMKEPILM